ncbi:hypothetical protein C5Y96_05715 [Blastopirellula marina]|uniref:Uncharacterized protein n=1 Tax=Blastopirellula marina TaxID=124 RepID=A0A2S8G504_9BACT|nr:MULTISPECIES: hypothetical protein [Pirellulaceae]PQO39351.1 hypothetical protein C5Y96_05715 [Blastopirellula marina]RCS55659.1 hypothetical protein DTL36_05725 [Bremerella cremea]
MPRTLEPDFSRPVEKFRSSIARGLAAGQPKENGKGETPVDREGGHYGAGIIRGFAVVTRGEALGHGYWLDQDFVEQTQKAMQALASGTKSRFTHPGLSSDGLGKLLGRAFDSYTDGDIVRADLHFQESAHDTPGGNLAKYVMDMAEEDPEAFGTSIVYMPDWGAEEKFNAMHKDEEGTFKSPDPDNLKNLPHARLGRLYAVDVVDEPAANPAGMFSADPIHADLEALAMYAFGLSEDEPELGKLSADPDRVRGFITRFFANHELELSMPKTNTKRSQTTEETKPKETETGTPETKPEGENAETTETSETSSDDSKDSDDEAEASTETSEDSAETAEPVANSSGRSEAVAELQKFTKAFGAENGLAWFNKGFTYEQSEELHAEHKRLQASADTEANSEKGGVSSNDEQSGKGSGFSNSLGKNLGAFAASLKKAK